MRLLFVAASPREGSASRKLARAAYDHAVREHEDHDLDWLDLGETHVQPFRGFGEEYDEVTRDAVERLIGCDGVFIAAPVYNGSYPAALKNVFEFVPYKDVAGRVAALAVSGGGERGLMQARSHLDALLTYFRIHVIPVPVYATRSAIEAGVPEDTARRVRALVDELARVTRVLRPAEAAAAARQVQGTTRRA